MRTPWWGALVGLAVVACDGGGASPLTLPALGDVATPAPATGALTSWCGRPLPLRLVRVAVEDTGAGLRGAIDGRVHTRGEVREGSYLETHVALEASGAFRIAELTFTHATTRARVIVAGRDEAHDRVRVRLQQGAVADRFDEVFQLDATVVLAGPLAGDARVDCTVAQPDALGRPPRATPVHPTNPVSAIIEPRSPLPVDAPALADETRTERHGFACYLRERAPLATCYAREHCTYVDVRLALATATDTPSVGRMTASARNDRAVEALRYDAVDERAFAFAAAVARACRPVGPKTPPEAWPTLASLGFDRAFLEELAARGRARLAAGPPP